MLDEQIRCVPWAVVDVETTGLYAHTGDRVCEVAVACVDPGGDLDMWTTLVDPGRPIDPEAASVNGLRDQELVGEPRFADLIPTIDDRLRNRLLVAHNAAFDIDFLTAEYAIARAAPPDVLVLDTLNLARREFRLPSNSLGPLAVQLGVPSNGLHRAAGDVAATYGVLLRMIELLEPRGLRTVRDFLGAQGTTVAFQPAPTFALPEPLAQAMGSSLLVTICYRDASGRTTERSVEPLWVNQTYLIAYCRLVKAQRTFRLDRIVDAWVS